MKGIGALVLAGGRSRRMKTNKAMLELEGISFLERILAQLKNFSECLLSVNKDEGYPHILIEKVVDA